ncbi:MAG: hypothetical protein R1F52_04325 [Candidatus Nitrosoabyssus spongiisocia]|nr:MAG: hypothetical protein R1F52_04325 [Nitrosopumilaceae archaeon AB1(1)]
MEKQFCAAVNYEENGFICYGFTVILTIQIQIIQLFIQPLENITPTSSQTYDITTILYFERVGNDVWIILNDIDTFLINDYIDDIAYMVTSFTLTKSGQGS